jgi:hypothetical protein
LAPRACDLVARVLDGQGLLPNPIVARALQGVDRLDRRFDAQRRQTLQQLFRDCTIGTEPAEHDATRGFPIEQVSGTLIPNYRRIGYCASNYAPQ